MKITLIYGVTPCNLVDIYDVWEALIFPSIFRAGDPEHGGIIFVFIITEIQISNFVPVSLTNRIIYVGFCSSKNVV